MNPGVAAVLLGEQPRAMRKQVGALRKAAFHLRGEWGTCCRRGYSLPGLRQVHRGASPSARRVPVLSSQAHLPGPHKLEPMARGTAALLQLEPFSFNDLKCSSQFLLGSVLTAAFSNQADVGNAVGSSLNLTAGKCLKKSF